MTQTNMHHAAHLYRTPHGVANIQLRRTPAQLSSAEHLQSSSNRVCQRTLDETLFSRFVSNWKGKTKDLSNIAFTTSWWALGPCDKHVLTRGLIVIEKTLPSTSRASAGQTYCTAHNYFSRRQQKNVKTSPLLVALSSNGSTDWTATPRTLAQECGERTPIFPSENQVAPSTCRYAISSPQRESGPCVGQLTECPRCNRRKCHSKRQQKQ